MKIERKPGASVAVKHAVSALAGAEGKVGWFPSAVYGTGAPVAGVAYVQEFGSPSRGIPPRLGMRSLAQEKKQAWAQESEKISRAAMSGKVPAENVMPLVCLAAEGALRAAITKVSSPPLKQSTINARKRKLADGGKGAAASIEKPLVATGLLLNSLTSEVIKK